MSEETVAGTQSFDSSSETIELRSRQETEMELTLGETPHVELTLRSVDERIKEATDPILQRVEELCALLASRTEMESAGNSKAPGSGRDRDFSSPLRNWYDRDREISSPSRNRYDRDREIFSPSLNR